ncbi:unnamed protein product [Zymoseptoria tritici ST99CH_1A5]|uniref:CBM1 domain-containing protein n=3 Tax=Zymoseptoria tritici TaxID=1047171 RepID=A0A1X7RJU2_ZYMT9|nr:unnamed protein product [Zymoseptoria tritici ST99CH_3D7]SMR46222.1 unnamed protein product [Zymoseptoria tritici ST99CH_1E4]SMR47472.1 unnamed protein product [Zymoseptoria tritici ST99CH_3D1]SMY21371.1 unnamed protein product [Zymoseptoria tritici ST99CH_1A5]
MQIFKLSIALLSFASTALAGGTCIRGGMWGLCHVDGKTKPCTGTSPCLPAYEGEPSPYPCEVNSINHDYADCYFGPQ